MALEIKLTQKLSQSLLMTPQLQQAIKLLQLGRIEYIEAIQQELLENPVLEENREEDSSSGDKEESTLSSEQAKESDSNVGSQDQAQGNNNDDSPVEWDDYISNFSDVSSHSSSSSYQMDDRPSLEATLSAGTSLQDHLLSQITVTDLPPKHRTILMHIICNLDRSGFLCCEIDEIVSDCKCEKAAALEVLELVQTLEPIGVGARNLRECLLLQLDAKGLGDSLGARILQNHLDSLEKRKYQQIAKTEKVSVEEVYEAILCIQALEPRPAKDFADDTTRYVVPDIYVYKDGDEYVISLNEDGLPKLKVNPFYLEMLQDKSSDSQNKSYLSERLKAASWLIKSIHQRQQTIYKVTESIVKFQHEFLEHGIEKLKPLVLKDVADDIGMHESTVSRVKSNKYVHTPQGVFELGFFFTTGIKTSGGELSSSSIKEKIKSIISSEDSSSPISDQRIVELLGEEGVEIARRTVAK
ncbi:MAG: RNA polymerase factor sigma-54, partial [Bdellovibrionales bacterium]|nr:RNA polymerase factor sigma-54 [Bdellovibrionales bacterium]